MKAISINQPWAWLIVNGYKDIENRSWATKVRGEVLIHASKKIDENFCYFTWENVIGDSIPTNLFTGGIIGKVDIVDCVDKSDSPWFFGKYGFVLKNGKQLLKPRICKGALGFFIPDYNSRYAEPKTKKKKALPLLDNTDDYGHALHDEPLNKG